MKRTSVFLLSLLLLAPGCAVQRPPTGGPIDEIPPTVEEVFPAEKALSVPRETEIQIAFSERMEKPSVEKAFFISPQPQTLPEFKWKGNRLIVKYDEPLLENKTYVISVGSAATDLHRQPFKETFSWAFSTGTVIDNGSISGRVYTGEEKNRALIWAYFIQPDSTINPFLNRGDYITQSDDEGNFNLAFLAPGTYRLFAIQDKNEDFYYQMLTEPIGSPPGDIVLEQDASVDAVFFQTAQTDTLPPVLVFVETPDKNNVRARFDEPLDESSLLSGNITIQSIGNGQSVPDSLLHIYQVENNENIVNIYSNVFTSGQNYQITFSNLSDIHRNSVARLGDSTTVFTVPSDVDTNRLQIVSLSPADSANNVSLYTPLVFSFNKPVNFQSFIANVSVQDSIGANANGTFASVSPVHVEFRPNRFWKPLMKYAVQISPGPVRALDGNPLLSGDSVTVFTTMDARQTGILQGTLTVSGLDSSDVKMIVKIEKEGTPPESREVILESPGAFSFNAVVRGDYTLSAFVDLDGNGKWTKGKVKPFQPAEPFVIKDKVVTIRPGFTNTGNDLAIVIR